MKTKLLGAIIVAAAAETIAIASGLEPYPNDPKALLERGYLEIGAVEKDSAGNDILFLRDRQSGRTLYRCETGIKNHSLPSDTGKNTRYPIRCTLTVIIPPTMKF